MHIARINVGFYFLLFLMMPFTPKVFSTWRRKHIILLWIHCSRSSSFILVKSLCESFIVYPNWYCCFRSHEDTRFFSSVWLVSFFFRLYNFAAALSFHRFRKCRISRIIFLRLVDSLSSSVWCGNECVYYSIRWDWTFKEKQIECPSARMCIRCIKCDAKTSFRPKTCIYPTHTHIQKLKKSI